jgi:hypothetical protein
MKIALIAMCILVSMNTKADIEFSTTDSGKATPQEISKNRACFEELKSEGCGGPGDDANHFRACLNNVHATLNEYCKKMMSDLYGN